MPETPVERKCSFCGEPFLDDSPGRKERHYHTDQCRLDRHKVARHLGEAMIALLPPAARVAYLENLKD